jgi:hypothetical protein
MMTLCWLAGGQYMDQCQQNGVSKPYVFKAFLQVIHAINSNPNIGGAPKWPTTVEECDIIANRWAKLSGPSKSRGFGCLMASLEQLGPLQRLKQTDLATSGLVTKKIGLRCQAICDSPLWFLFVSVQLPGIMNNLKAYRMSRLCDLIEGLLPERYLCGGDNAYVNTEHLAE